jgi:hypothetical protein
LYLTDTKSSRTPPHKKHLQRTHKCIIHTKHNTTQCNNTSHKNTTTNLKTKRKARREEREEGERKGRGKERGERREEERRYGRRDRRRGRGSPGNISSSLNLSLHH